MKILVIPFLLIANILSAQNINIDSLIDSLGCSGTLMVTDVSSNKTSVCNPELVKKAVKPGNTLNLFLTLVALEEGIIEYGKTNVYLDCDELGTKCTNDPIKALQFKYQPFFIELSKKIGRKTLSKYLIKEKFGSGKFKKMESEYSLDESGLLISPQEQNNFWMRVFKGESDFSKNTVNNFKSMFSNEDGIGYKLNVNPSEIWSDGNVQNWTVGWLEQNGEIYVFSQHFHFTHDFLDQSRLESGTILRNGLNSLGLYDAPEKQRLADSIAAIKADTNYSLKSFYGNNPNLAAKVDAIVSKMTKSQIAGQMIIPAAGRWGNSSADIEKAIKAGKIGGLLLLKGEKQEFINLVKKYNDLSAKSGSLPLMYSSDAEPSLFNGKIKNTATVPKTNTLNTVEKSRNAANIIDRELNEIGIQYNYAPDCDLGINKAIIGDRSYGNDTKTVAELSQAFITQSTMDNIVTTAKHFPGHGLVKGDSHLNLVVIDGEMKELDTYKRLIKDSVLSIMVGHIAVKNNEKYHTNGLPSSCSPKIVTKLLREEMGFDGLIITDGMGMGALNAFDNASLQAAMAGCDLILMPTDILGLHKAILEKINKNSDFEKQALLSVNRIIRLKICLGIIK